MPLLQRKRRAPVEEPEDDDVEDSRNNEEASEPVVDDDDDTNSNDPNESAAADHLVKNLIRLALASEYSRQPLRRADIVTKVLGAQSRQFRSVFDEAQVQLRSVFGMEMVELPLKEKVTIQQRRAAQRSDKVSASSNSWILRSTLPDKYKDAEMLVPPKVPTVEAESAYVGLYTFVISVIYLSGGQLPEAKLDRFLRRMNADQSTPIDKTDKLLQRMIKEGYIVKLKDSSSGEELVDYMVGPRGKTEVGPEGIAGLVRTVYGPNATDDLEQRLDKSLGLSDAREIASRRAAQEQQAEANSAGRARGRPRRHQPQEHEMEEDDDEE